MVVLPSMLFLHPKQNWKSFSYSPAPLTSKTDSGCSTNLLGLHSGNSSFYRHRLVDPATQRLLPRRVDQSWWGWRGYQPGESKRFRNTSPGPTEEYVTINRTLSYYSFSTTKGVGKFPYKKAFQWDAYRPMQWPFGGGLPGGCTPPREQADACKNITRCGRYKCRMLLKNKQKYLTFKRLP